jgi:hypothetical protein
MGARRRWQPRVAGKCVACRACCGEPHRRHRPSGRGRRAFPSTACRACADGRSILSHGMPAPPHRAGTGASCCSQSPSLGSSRCARGARHDGGRPCQLETLRALAANGANLDLVNEAGATPLVWAALGGQADVRLSRHTVPRNTHIWRTRRSQHAHRAARVHRARRRPTCVAAAAVAATFCEHDASDFARTDGANSGHAVLQHAGDPRAGGRAMRPQPARRARQDCSDGCGARRVRAWSRCR